MIDSFVSIDVGGRMLRCITGGDGDPTVVLDLGMSMSIEHSRAGPIPLGWSKVFRDVKKFSRMVMYDRAGVGESDPAPLPRTSLDMVRDLHALLRRMNVTPPFVFVGHSLGGMNVRLYAHMYPEEVGGIVLVDSTHPEQRKRFSSIIPPPAQGEAPLLRLFRARLAPSESTEGFDWDAAEEQVRAVSSLGKMPLVVISHSPNYPMGSEVPKELADKIQGAWLALQTELLALSSNSRHVVASHAGHNIQVDEPELIAGLIASVVEDARTTNRIRLTH